MIKNKGDDKNGAEDVRIIDVTPNFLLDSTANLNVKTTEG
jgi:hypothetical protein